jgi:hypothetical protein
MYLIKLAIKALIKTIMGLCRMAYVLLSCIDQKPLVIPHQTDTNGNNCSEHARLPAQRIHDRIDAA